MAPKLALAALAALILATPQPAKAEEVGANWSVSGLEPLGQPIGADATVIGYVRRDQRTYLQARNPASGGLLWEAEAEAHREAPVRAGRWIVYREPAEGFGPGYASLVVADPRTGRQIQRSPSMIFSGTPESCFENRAVCVTAAPEPEEAAHGYRLDLISGAFVPSADGIPGEGLIRIGTDITLIRDGKVLWRRPDPGAISRPEPGAPRDLEPSAPSRPAPSAPIGPAPSAPRGPEPSAPTRPEPAGVSRADAGTTGWTEFGGVWSGATRTGSAGLSAADGRLLWTAPGVLTDCGLPPGTPEIRCRAGRIERFDPLTGKAHWSAPLRGPVGVTAGAIVVRGVAISRNTGERAPATTAYWCLARGLATVCGDEGTPPITAWTAVGAVAAGYAVVATPAGYLGRSVDPAP
ncbi:hypothetical protein ACTI_53910 [Actinoplanes sp. OR16]|uniref:hypothetical protein n=1 Tax=Actinoplanes sp. OR16 TaxID=946334 RepID=UPI000F705006|nr:hypothetical protein [Actinoplanes sp. OR16]BBH68706.1 hypothetical protein ACTI_53910 [Actinoplanes sp. OR16]